MKTPSPGPTANDEDAALNDRGDDASEPEGAGESSAEHDLVRRVQAGDTGAFRELFDRYHRRAFVVAYAVVKNRQDALDIVQDAFIKVHRHIQSFQGTSSFYTWLYRIVMNLAIDHVRRGKKGKDVDYDDRMVRDEEEGGNPVMPRIAGANPLKTVMRHELRNAMEKALESLPEYHRAVIVLREVDGLSYEEMSKILNVPKGTIMSRLFHARRKMQDALAEYLGGDLKIEG